MKSALGIEIGNKFDVDVICISVRALHSEKKLFRHFDRFNCIHLPIWNILSDQKANNFFIFFLVNHSNCVSSNPMSDSE